MPDEVMVVILGGGKGTRLYPLTRDRTKAAVPLAGRFRLVDIPISNSLNSGFDRIFVLTQFNSFSLNRHIHRAYGFGSYVRSFIETISAEQTLDDRECWFRGTADAVRKVLPHLRKYRPKHVLILQGDQLYKMDFRPFLEAHREREGCSITIAAIPVARWAAPDLGILQIDKTNRIKRFVEKPKSQELLDSLTFDGKRYLASMGIYLFETEILEEMLESEHTDFGKELLPEAIEHHDVQSYVFEGYWEDIGTVKAFHEANLKLVGDSPPLDFFDDDWPMFTQPRMLPASRMDGCTIKGSAIAEGCTIRRSTIEDSIVGIRTMIGEGCSLSRSIVMGADFYDNERERALNRKLGRNDIGIGQGCTFRNVIIDKNARIGRNVRLVNEKGVEEFEDEHIIVRDGIVVVPRGGSVPDGYEF